MSWQELTFGNFAEIQPQVKLEKGTAYSFIGMADVLPHTKNVIPGSTRTWKGSGGSKFENGDIIFARITPCLEHGKTAKVSNLTDSKGFGSTEFFVFRDREGISDPDYIYYLARSPVIREPAIKSMTGASGRQRAQKIVVENTSIRVPEIQEQRRIASILSAYDNLIENNQRRIQLLEQSAQLLYKEWFVHLRFPGHEHVTITDSVPEGWIKKPLSALCTDIRKSINPKALSPDVPYIGLEHIPRHSITLDSWGKAAEVDSNKFRFSKGDILFGKIRPYFHKVGFALVDGITSSDAIVIRPTEDRLYFYVLSLLASNEFVALASKTVREGSKMPRADWKFLLKSEFKVPSMALLDFFNETMNPICNQLRTLALHNRKLAHSRDLLLSRLMNGEISI